MLAHVLDSLVRVSRRVDQRRSASITNPPEMDPRHGRQTPCTASVPDPRTCARRYDAVPRPCGSEFDMISAPAIGRCTGSRRQDTAVRPAHRALNPIPISHRQIHETDAGSLL